MKIEENVKWLLFIIPLVLIFLAPRTISFLTGNSFFTKSPTTYPIMSFIFIFLLLSGSYFLLLRVKRKKLLLFLTTLVVLPLFLSIEPVGWDDAESHYNAEVYAAEKGVLTFIKEYHMLGLNTIEENITTNAIMNFLTKIHLDGLFNRYVAKVGSTAGVPATRTPLFHPPTALIIFSIFMKLFGANRMSAVWCEWLIAAAVPVIIYSFVNKLSGTRTAIKTALLFISAPAFLFHTSSPLLDIVLGFFLILSSFFFLVFMEKKKLKYAVSAGLMVALSLTSKITGLIVLPLLFLMSLKKRSKGVLYFIAVVVLSLIPLLLYALLDYYYFFNIIFSRIMINFRIQRIGVSLFRFIVIPLHAHFQYGIVLIPAMLFLMLNFKKQQYKVLSLSIIFCFYSMIFILYGSELWRHLLALLPLFYVAVSSSFKRISDKTVVSIIGINLSLLLLYVFP